MSKLASVALEKQTNKQIKGPLSLRQRMWERNKGTAFCALLGLSVFRRQPGPHKHAAHSTCRHFLIESLKTINYQSFHSSCSAKDTQAIKGIYPRVSRGLFVIKM